jgi:DNA adenine methylase
MNQASPLRYPGGKSSMAGLLREVRRLNKLGSSAMGEPFAGGAGASLTLLFEEATKRISINDADPAIHDFWWTVLNRPRPFLQLIESAPLSIDEWLAQRAMYRLKSSSRLKRAFSTFYLNRCNRSGIIVNGGPIGGIEQRGEWKLDARFNRSDLKTRCERVNEFKDRIDLSGIDGLDYIRNADEDVFLFIDPPYYHKGGLLYLNALTPEYHGKLAALLRTRKNSAWVLTYDDCPQIRELYRDWATVRPFSLRYAAAERKAGRELLICPKSMRLPNVQESRAISW